MTIFLIIIVVIGLVFFISQGAKTTNLNQTKRLTKINETNSQKNSINDYSTFNNTTKSKVTQALPTVAELVKAVNTIEDFEKFEKKQKEVDALFSQDYDNKQNEKLYRRYESAFATIANKLSDKIFYYQYLPELDLETPNKDLLDAFEVCTVEQYKLRKSKHKDCWEEITGNELMGGNKLENCIKIKPDYTGTLVQFRNIVESNLTLAQKHHELIDLINNNVSFKKKYFYDTRFSVENQALIWLIKQYEIPQVEKLFELGYDTPEKLKKLTNEQLVVIKGFGEKSLDQFRKTIKKLK
jgi:hypothetical protein